MVHYYNGVIYGHMEAKISLCFPFRMMDFFRSKHKVKEREMEQPCPVIRSIYGPEIAKALYLDEPY